ncbi:unnamed protein product [Vicia faba]|uniref:RNase H type-1 domain-containing protein n=1 Tax=Vicia faba TaxID=3906 RepID=A0AAV0Z8G1_VICFA|nr:unnamed protein product [Vicia faba]
MLLDTTCTLCDESPKSARHLFLQCEYYGGAYFSSPLGFRIPPNVDILNWLLICLDGTDTMQVQLICTLLWKLWSSRNFWHFQQKFKEPQLNGPLAHENCLVGVDNEIVEFQSDAGCLGDDTVAFSCLLKTWDSKVIYAACRKEVLRVDSAIAEMLAIRWSQELAKDFHYEKILVQSNVSIVVDCVMFLSRHFNVASHNIVGLESC